MWILVIVTVSGPISFPGYETRAACEAAYRQMYENSIYGTNFPPFHDVWKDGRCVPAPR
jgi:hypothetical protein